MKDSTNDYDCVRSIAEEYIRGVESISIARVLIFSWKPHFLFSLSQEKQPQIATKKICYPDNL